MSLAIDHGSSGRGAGLAHALVFGALFPVFMATEGLHRLGARASEDGEAPAHNEKPWLAEARSGATIAASYVLMARSMLQTSGRRPRPVRPS